MVIKIIKQIWNIRPKSILFSDNMKNLQLGLVVGNFF